MISNQSDDGVVLMAERLELANNLPRKVIDPGNSQVVALSHPTRCVVRQWRTTKRAVIRRIVRSGNRVGLTENADLGLAIHLVPR